jgi:transcriptional regulator with XRE-family HTH domain
MIKIYFGKVIVKLRTSKGMSQKKFYETIGFARSWTSDVERGNKLPSWDMIDKICEVFEITEIQFLEMVIKESKALQK